MDLDLESLEEEEEAAEADSVESVESVDSAELVGSSVAGKSEGCSDVVDSEVSLEEASLVVSVLE